MNDTQTLILVVTIFEDDTSVFPAIGEGSDVRLTGTDIAGAALVAGGRGRLQ